MNKMDNVPYNNQTINSVSSTDFGTVVTQAENKTDKKMH